MIRRLLAWAGDYTAALAEIAELRESVQSCQRAAHLHAMEAQRARGNADAWERSARKLRADLLGAEAMLHLSEQRCEALEHRVNELARRLHPSSGGGE